METLSQYFSCGGNYDETADSLAIHCEVHIAQGAER
ncbi:helix-turn-helix domain-containing protein [Streptomyces maremycinicus]|nr:helix-turn-helix domain-containing protein [Streptomyces sp. NBRC 110468]